MKAYLWSTNDGNAIWTVNGRQRPRQGMKPVSGKIANCSSYYYYYSRRKFIPRQLIRGCRYCSINSTYELRLLMSSAFWIKKESTGRQNTPYMGSN